MIKADATDTAPHVWLGSSGLHLRGLFRRTLAWDVEGGNWQKSWSVLPSCLSSSPSSVCLNPVIVLYPAMFIGLGYP